jgi:hypothetical protein
VTRLFPIPDSIRRGLAAAAIVCCAAVGAARGDDGFLLIDRALTTRHVTDVVINERMVAYRDEAGALHPVPLADCLALMHGIATTPVAGAGELRLADGQRLPGLPATSAPASGDMLVWTHPWLGRVDVPLDRVAAATFRPNVPLPTTGEADVVRLGNGDRLEGFITSLDRGITIEVEGNGPIREAQIPFERVAALALITPPQPARGQRVWFRDGTVLEVKRLEIGDDGWVRVTTLWASDQVDPVRVRLSDIVGVLFDPDALVPLGSLTPSGVEGTAVRYELPAPKSLDEGAPLGLGGVEYRGPYVVRYALPSGARRFAADAMLPPMARTWGDVELIVRDDDNEVFRARLSGEHPMATINVALRGSELTIELDQGANGPIQDRVLLQRAVLLVQ